MTREVRWASSEGDPRIAILGAGPVGLDAALAAHDAGLPFTVYEAGDQVGRAVRRWGHVRLFSPWSMNASPRMRTHLEAAGVGVPDGDACPTGRELVERVLEPVARLEHVRAQLRTGHRVVAVSREGLLKHEAIGDPERARRPFRILIRTPDGERVEHADVVLDCTGTYDNPHPLGAGGIPAPGEGSVEERIVRHVPDVGGEPEAWTDARVLLVGSGHSAQTAARDLAELARSIDDDDGGSGRDAPRVLWAVRAEEPGWGAVDDDPLPERARLVERARKLASGSSPAVHLRTGVRVQALEAVPTGIRVTLGGNDSREEVEVDRIVALTGYVGDHRLYRQLQVHECWATSGPMKLAAALLGSSSEDCLDETSHGADVLVNPEPGFFLVGSKSYGRNNTFLLRVGWRQVDEVFGLVRTAAAS